MYAITLNAFSLLEEKKAYSFQIATMDMSSGVKS